MGTQSQRRVKSVKVLLIDCDWEEGVTLSPNPWLLKTSSFFKQMNNSVELSRGEPNINRYDLIFVFKEQPTNYMPPPNILNNTKTRLHGKPFRVYKNYWDLTENIFKARPDYYLYEDKYLTEQDYATYSFGKRLIESQPFIKNEKSNEDTVVIDDIWSLNDDDLLYVIKDLSKYPKIHFLQPINFLRFNEEILQNFLKLSFSKRQNKAKKVFDLQALETSINLVKEIKSKRRFYLGDIDIVAATRDSHSGIRFMECIKMIKVANTNRVKLNFLIPKARFEELALFQYLSLYKQDISFIEYLIKTETKEDTLEVILNDRHYGFAVDLARELYFKKREIFEDGLIAWGGTTNIKL